VAIDDATFKHSGCSLEHPSAPFQSKAPTFHCLFCGSPKVTTTTINTKTGISGGKLSGALLTGGASVLLTGLSRKERQLIATCHACGIRWNLSK